MTENYYAGKFQYGLGLILIIISLDMPGGIERTLDGLIGIGGLALGSYYWNKPFFDFLRR